MLAFIFCRDPKIAGKKKGKNNKRPGSKKRKKTAQLQIHETVPVAVCYMQSNKLPQKSLIEKTGLIPDLPDLVHQRALKPG
jgi:hypothetical protein